MTDDPKQPETNDEWHKVRRSDWLKQLEDLEKKLEAINKDQAKRQPPER